MNISEHRREYDFNGSLANLSISSATIPPTHDGIILLSTRRVLGTS